jgi:hypothetical protein
VTSDVEARVYRRDDSLSGPTVMPGCRASSSGFSPVIAASLLALAGGGTNIFLVAGFMVIVALVSAIAPWRAPETRDVPLTTGSGSSRSRVDQSS